MQYLPVKFHFLNNNKSYNRDFFTIDTIDDGLSFHGIESFLLSNIFKLILYTISRKHGFIEKASWSNQCDRPTRE